ncbi:hypothetical protein QQX98_002050 [Neonectria punicea]|uniref:Gylcosyl hydrolase 115 C-terminal domain-containing protein n=1 Tax=Neonectria punicea TaxID=979145 RepID=A0ABR1HK39_9HYPO
MFCRYLLWLVLPTFALALLEERFVSFKPADGAIQIQGATIVHDASDPIGIQIAANSLADDLEKISGITSKVLELDIIKSNGSLQGVKASDNVVILATADSRLVQTLKKQGKVNVSEIEGKWETFKTTLVKNPLPGTKNGLLIVGSDKRGTMFGAYTLGEQSGQSPLHWWADVPATKHTKIYALPKTTIHGEPTVKFRGLFINDEAPSLTGWWARHHNVTDYTLDSEFYEHVFDLLLRLKANFLWPAMWASFVPGPGRRFFTDDPRNQQLADDYGIVVSTSHHEPMQKASNEWDADEQGLWDWVKNNDNVTRFMEEGIQRAGKNESYFTLGMRGPNDGAIQADDPIAVLEDVFAKEREILAKYHGNETAANQVWTIYKEVATYYAAGLVPPEDVTLMFTDDNWGNIQRLPTESERERSGGIGLYYHFQYVGRPKSWKWQNTNNLPKVFKELYHAYQRGADQIWVMNVGDLKPMELPLSFAMDLAWNASRFDFETIPTYLESFTERDFGPEHAEDIASILLTYSHLVGMRKFESTEAGTYSLLNFHEAERILKAWEDLVARTTEVGDSLAEDRQDAFYHLVAYPVLAGANYHAVVIGQARNYRFSLERRNSANVVAQQVLEDFEADADFVQKYDKIAGGKWAGIAATPKFDVSTGDWRPASRDVVSNLSYVQSRQNFDYGFGNLGIYAEQSSSAYAQGRICASINAAWPTKNSFSPQLPSLDPYSPQVRTIDLFHRGDHRVPLGWSVQIPYDWIQVTPTEGTLTQDRLEQRLNVSIDWSKVPAGLEETVKIRFEWDPEPYFDLVHLPIRNERVPDDFRGFPEASGLISIEAPHFQRASDEDVAFEHIQLLGTRSESGSIALRPYKAARASTTAAEAAWVEYDIYIFSDSSPGLIATIYVNGALDTDPDLPMKYSLSLVKGSETANFTRLLDEPSTAGDVPPGWTESVADHVWTRKLALGSVKPGAYTLRWQVNSPEVYLEKIVLDVQGRLAQSYLGPPETPLVG